MKKPILKVRGSFVLGVFIVAHVYITKDVAEHENNKHLPLKEGWLEYTQLSDETCGGKKKPISQAGEGDYFCVNGEWVWFPA